MAFGIRLLQTMSLNATLVLMTGNGDYLTLKPSTEKCSAGQMKGEMSLKDVADGETEEGWVC